MENGEKVYIVVEDCDNDETQNVACFGTEEEAETFCKERTPRFRSLVYEEWEVGEVIDDYKQ